LENAMPPSGAIAATARTVRIPREHYNPVTRGLHGLAAVVIICAWALGISLESFPSGPQRLSAVEVHTVLGLTVLTLAVLRILVRLVTRSPENLGPAWNDFIARLGHFALYAVTLAVPLAGLMARLARSGSVSLPGGYSIPAPPFPIVGSKDFWAQTHQTLAFALAVLVVGHLLASAWHQWVLRDDVWGRISRGPRR
jgi:cytochrome b561